MKKYAVLVAGGNGQRMQSEIPKQFLQIAGKPILFYTIEKFYEFSQEIVLVLPQKDRAFWENICVENNFFLPVSVVTGGLTRYASVKNALQFIINKEIDTENTLVAIHDGVRPLVSSQVIVDSYETASHKGVAVAAVHLKDSLRQVEEMQKNKSVPREAYRLVQTPQTFLLSKIWEAFQKVPESSILTDDASVYEQAGNEIFLIEGNYENIKITTPEDLKVAAALLGA